MARPRETRQWPLLGAYRDHTGTLQGTVRDPAGTLEEPWRTPVRTLEEPQRSIRTFQGDWEGDLSSLLSPEENQLLLKPKESCARAAREKTNASAWVR